MQSKTAHPTNAGTIPSAGQGLREAFTSRRRGEIFQNIEPNRLDLQQRPSHRTGRLNRTLDRRVVVPNVAAVGGWCAPQTLALISLTGSLELWGRSPEPVVAR